MENTWGQERRERVGTGAAARVGPDWQLRSLRRDGVVLVAAVVVVEGRLSQTLPYGRKGLVKGEAEMSNRPDCAKRN